MGRLSAHLRQHVVGYIALFAALSGTAVALPGKNSVDSGDIKNNKVKSVDIKDEGVGGVDLGANSVGASEARANSLTGADIAEETLDGVDADLLDGLPTSSFGGSVIGQTTLPDGNVTKYAAVSGVAPAVDIENEVVTVSPAQTLVARNLYVQVGGANQQAGEAWSVTLRRAGADTLFKCTTVESQCANDTFAETIAAGSVLVMKITASGNPSGRPIGYAFQLAPL